MFVVWVLKFLLKRNNNFMEIYFFNMDEDFNCVCDCFFVDFGMFVDDV